MIDEEVVTDREKIEYLVHKLGSPMKRRGSYTYVGDTFEMVRYRFSVNGDVIGVVRNPTGDKGGWVE